MPVAYSRDIIAALREAGSSPRYTEFPGEGHVVWPLAFDDPDLLDWLFAPEAEPQGRPGMTGRLRVAAVCTVYYAASHADAIVTKFLKGMSTDEGFFPPEVDVVSLYLDQVPEKRHRPRPRPGARRSRVPEHPPGPDAGRLPPRRRCGAAHRRARRLPVERARQDPLPPGARSFEQIAGEFGHSRRSVPVFNDKHLAWDFTDALWMWNRARQLRIPLMAGSCLPLAWRNPWLEHERGAPGRGSPWPSATERSRPTASTPSRSFSAWSSGGPAARAA